MLYILVLMLSKGIEAYLELPSIYHRVFLVGKLT